MTNDKQRERLVDLLAEVYPKTRYIPMEECREKVADYLLDHNVVALPCDVGDVVRTKYGYTFKVEKIEILKDKKIFRCGNPNTDDYMAFFEDEIGTEVFLTKEEAEAKLKEGVQG